MKGLSPQQRKIVLFIRDYINNTAIAPTVYEIAEYLGIKTSTAFAHICALQKKNVIARTSKARSMKLIENVNKNNNYLQIPLLHDPADIDFNSRRTQYVYYDVKKKYEQFKDDLCSLRTNFDLNNSFNILDGDILTLIRRPDHFVLESGMLLLVWDPRRKYYFARYDGFTERICKIIAVVIELQRSL